MTGALCGPYFGFPLVNSEFDYKHFSVSKMGLHEGVIYIQQHDPNQPHQIIVQQQPVVSEHGQGGLYTLSGDSLAAITGTGLLYFSLSYINISIWSSRILNLMLLLMPDTR